MEGRDKLGCLSSWRPCKNNFPCGNSIFLFGPIVNIIVDIFVDADEMELFLVQLLPHFTQTVLHPPALSFIAILREVIPGEAVPLSSVLLDAGCEIIEISLNVLLYWTVPRHSLASLATQLLSVQEPVLPPGPVAAIPSLAGV